MNAVRGLCLWTARRRVEPCHDHDARAGDKCDRRGGSHGSHGGVRPAVGRGVGERSRTTPRGGRPRDHAPVRPCRRDRSIHEAMIAGVMTPKEVSSLGARSFDARPVRRVRRRAHRVGVRPSFMAGSKIRRDRRLPPQVSSGGLLHPEQRGPLLPGHLAQPVSVTTPRPSSGSYGSFVSIVLVGFADRLALGHRAVAHRRGQVLGRSRRLLEGFRPFDGPKPTRVPALARPRLRPYVARAEMKRRFCIIHNFFVPPPEPGRDSAGAVG